MMLSIGLYGHGMHDLVLREVEIGIRAALYEDMEADGFSALDPDPDPEVQARRSGRSFQGAGPPRTRPTHYGPVSPRYPRTAINNQRSPPPATCEHEARAGFEPVSNAREHPRNA